MGEHRVGVLLGVVAGVALVLRGLVADAVGLLLGEADNLLVAREDHRLLLGVGDDGARLLLGAVDGLLLLLEDAARVGELLREDAANLVQDLVDVLGVDDLLLPVVHDRGLSLGHDLLELVDQALDLLTWLHLWFLSRDSSGAKPDGRALSLSMVADSRRAKAADALLNENVRDVGRLRQA